MIRRIRRRHLIVWLVLSVALLLLLAASVVFRHAAPVNRTIPPRSANGRPPAAPEN
jgi:hypothetical protein